MQILSNANVLNYLSTLGIFSNNELVDTKIRAGKSTTKNFSLFLRLSNNKQIIVKQERVSLTGYFPNELSNEWKFQSYVNQNEYCSRFKNLLREILFYDSENLIGVYSYLDHYQEFYADILQVEFPFPPCLAAWISHGLATVHQTTFQREDLYDWATQPGSFWNQIGASFNLLKTRITPEILSIASPDYIKLISLYQKFQSLEDAKLTTIHGWRPCCAVHNDLNVANILVHEKWNEFKTLNEANTHSAIKIIDWERWSWGDPVLDLGNLIANYMLLWLNSMVIDSLMSLEETIQTATISLKDIQPSLQSIVLQYIETFPEITTYFPDFFERLVRYIGLSTLIQTQAKVEHHKLLSNSDIYTLQLSKSLLCKPEKSFSSVFGCVHSSFNNQNVFASV